MSTQPHQRVRRNASPSTKQGPIKATIAFSAINPSPTRLRSSPVLSPVLWSEHRLKSTRKSPNNKHSPERSTISPNFKVEKPKPLRPHSGPILKRTGSYDTIVVNQYLSGQWPKEQFQNHGLNTSTSSFMLDKSTQTDDGDGSSEKTNDHKRSLSVGNGDHLKELIKQRLQRTKENSRPAEHSKARQSPVQGSHAALWNSSSTAFTQPKPIAIPTNSRFCQARHPRSSVEGLNTEIEKLVLCHLSEDERGCEPIPDGHRAPLPGSTRNVDTQTPSANGHISDDITTASESRSISPAVPIIPGLLDSSRPSSCADSTESLTTVLDDSPDVGCMQKYATSPRPNKSYAFVRQPPDGCEKVKVIDENKRPVIKEPLLLGPIKTNQVILKPSDGSAFCPLAKFCHPIENRILPQGSIVVQTTPIIETQ